MTPPAGSALYVGEVMHQRLRPRRHRLSYRVWSLLLDLDELPALDRRLRFFSLNRGNLVSLHERDYGPRDEAGAGLGLRVRIERQLRAAGLPAGGPIRLLTMPRLLGYAFNPLNVYFCHAADGRLAAMLYEVNNTFGERHAYLIAVDGDGAAAIEQRCAKAFHVSPFLGLEMDYRFRIEPPAERLSIGVAAHDRDGLVLNARHDAARRPLGDAALLRVCLTHPLLTLKVIAAIHWEALKLLAKGLGITRKPAPPARPVTVIQPQDP